MYLKPSASLLSETETGAAFFCAPELVAEENEGGQVRNSILGLDY